MPKGYTHPKFIAPPPPRSGKDSTKVAIVGAGLVGLTVAIDLAQRGISVILLDDDDTTSHGSRLICISKRTLEIFDRIGIGKLLEEKGVIWNKGRLFFQDDEI
jgi:3-(3-hydroxy-phenyl)propionate hydroxylase